MGGPSINRAESSGDIWTPWEFIRAVEYKFGPIGIDLAASGLRSAKALEYITPEDDSLKQDWATLLNGRLGWDNCPYSNIAPWAKYHMRQWERGAKTLLLVPGSVGANWYWDHVARFATTYSVGRMVFDNCFDRKTGKLVTTVYPKDLILCHYDPSVEVEYPPRLHRWQWKHLPSDQASSEIGKGAAGDVHRVVSSGD